MSPLTFTRFETPHSTTYFVSWRARFYASLQRSRASLRLTIWTEDPGAN